jgi:hypothetical protein
LTRPLTLIQVLSEENKSKFGSKLKTIKAFILLSDALVLNLKDGINNTLLSLN